MPIMHYYRHFRDFNNVCVFSHNQYKQTGTHQETGACFSIKRNGLEGYSHFGNGAFQGGQTLVDFIVGNDQRWLDSDG